LEGTLDVFGDYASIVLSGDRKLLGISVNIKGYSNPHHSDADTLRLDAISGCTESTVQMLERMIQSQARVRLCAELVWPL
jgi:hypothetical protein